MRPVKPGDRGPAVADIQKRLRVLGCDLGPTGIDGVFLGKTLAAVQTFQRERMLQEDGVVGPQTWAALVDETFVLGDRMLYLRHPYFHGRDVRELQGALNALGFACGAPDGIFGAFTERAVRDFQVNTGQHPDGIAGFETVRAVVNLRHVWAEKDPHAPVALQCGPARVAEVLAETSVSVAWLDETARLVAERFANLAVAAQPLANVVLSERAGGVADVRLAFASAALESDEESPAIDVASGEAVLAVRFLAALAASTGARPVRLMLPPLDAGDERALQRVAVTLLDSMCTALAEKVVPIVRNATIS